MKINKEQYDALVAKLDFMQGFLRAVQEENARIEQSLTDHRENTGRNFSIHADRLLAIEQGLDKLLQSHAALEKQMEEQRIIWRQNTDVVCKWLAETGGKLNALAAAKKPAKRAKR